MQKCNRHSSFKRSAGRRLAQATFSIMVVSRMVCPAWGDDLADADLVDVQMINSKIRIELRYATRQNFLGRILYSTNKCYLRRSVAEKLSNAEHKLEKLGLGLKVWDAYRPLRVQKELWAILPDARYVARPEKGSRHNRGAAVDVTLVDQNGKALEMPTGFDDFSEKAAAFAQGLSDKAIANRRILQNAMIASGFTILESEWWHFDDAGWKRFGLLDIEPGAKKATLKP
jgi:D-alanyl-D-alanine dipeptidase